MKAILLAGGKGTRLRPLTLHTPKPIVPIFNRPFLHYQIDLIRQIPEIDEIILSLNYQPRRIEDVFGDGSSLGIKIRYVVEPAPLGTGGAVKFAAGGVTDSIVVFNGDVLTQVDLAAVLASASLAQGTRDDRADAGGQPERVRPGRNRRGAEHPAVPREAQARRDHHQLHQRRHLRAGAVDVRPHPAGHGMVHRAQLLPVVHRTRRDVCRVPLRRVLDRHRHAREVHAGAPRHHGRPLSDGAVCGTARRPCLPRRGRARGGWRHRRRPGVSR